MSAAASLSAGYADETHGLPMDVRLMNMTAVFLGVAACAFGLALLAKWTLAQPIFAVTRIVVQGDTTHHNAITLKANVGGRINGNFFTLDLAQVRQVFESVPWVRKATVQREFPNRLRVTLQEHRSSAFWGVDSESRMVNTLGEVFEANAGDTEMEELPRLIASEGRSAQVLAMYRQLSAVLLPLDVVIDELQLSGQGAWRMTLDGGAEVELGRGQSEEIIARLRNFVSTQAQVLSAYQRSGLDRVESVDLRHSEGYAIRLRGVSTLIASDKK